MKIHRYTRHLVLFYYKPIFRCAEFAIKIWVVPRKTKKRKTRLVLQSLFQCSPLKPTTRAVSEFCNIGKSWIIDIIRHCGWYGCYRQLITYLWASQLLQSSFISFLGINKCFNCCCCVVLKKFLFLVKNLFNFKQLPAKFSKRLISIAVYCMIWWHRELSE